MIPSYPISRKGGRKSRSNASNSTSCRQIISASDRDSSWRIRRNRLGHECTEESGATCAYHFCVWSKRCCANTFQDNTDICVLLLIRLLPLLLDLEIEIELELELPSYASLLSLTVLILADVVVASDWTQGILGILGILQSPSLEVEDCDELILLLL